MLPFSRLKHNEMLFNDAQKAKLHLASAWLNFLTLNRRMQAICVWCFNMFYFPPKTMAVTECHPFVGLHYRATTHFACHIYIANTAGHITSPTSKAASWKAQRILAEIYSPHLYASETCWSEVISRPLPFCASCVKLANALMTHFQNFYTCKDKPLQPSQPPVIKPNPLLLYTKWKSYNPLNQHLSQFIKGWY